MKKIVIHCVIICGLAVGSISAADAQNAPRKSFMRRLSHQATIMQRGLAAAKKRHIQRQQLTKRELRYYNAALKRLGGLTALLAAIGIGVGLGVKYKKRQVAERRVEADQQTLNTRLMDAALCGHADVVRQLLDAGADVNATNLCGTTALMSAAGNGRAYVVRQLLDAGANVNATDLYGTTALMFAAGWGDADVVGQLLVAGADVNATNWDGTTALMFAAGNGRADVVGQLLDAGAYVNATNRDGNTALTRAARWGHADVVEILLAGSSEDNRERAARQATERLHPEIAQIIREYNPR